MRFCAYCKKSFNKGMGKLFCVPKSVEARKKWSEICGMNFSARAELCSDHFCPSSIIAIGKGSRLLASAEPIAKRSQKVKVSTVFTEQHCILVDNDSTGSINCVWSEDSPTFFGSTDDKAKIALQEHKEETQTHNSNNLRCIVGCLSANKLYKFPSIWNNKSRRKLWLDFFHIKEPNTENIYACDKHFSFVQVKGKGIRIDAVPDIPLNTTDIVEKIENTVSECDKTVSQQIILNPDNIVEIEEQPIYEVPIIKSVSCTAFSQTNTRLCGSVEVSEFADEFRFNCFYCPKVFQLNRWKSIIKHLNQQHFEREAAFKVSKYVSDDHDYTPVNKPESASVVNGKSSFLADPEESTYESVYINPDLYYIPDECNNVNILNNLVENESSAITNTVFEMENKFNYFEKEPKTQCFKNVKNKPSKDKNALNNKTKVISSGVLYLKDPKLKKRKKTTLSRCLKRSNTKTIELCDKTERESIPIENVQQKPTEIVFEYSPQDIVNLLLDSMKNYPVLWQFDEEPFNQDFYEAVEILCKIINDKWSLNIDNLKMRRSINRILRFYCYLFPNQNIENIHQFTCFYDKCATFLPSSVNEIAYARCSHCYMCYKNDFDLKRHLLDEHKYLQWPYKCIQCKECFLESDEYEFHKGLQHYDEIFRCEPCNKTFIRRNVYNSHISEYHTKDTSKQGEFKCDLCDKLCPTIGSLRYHKMCHGERKYKCDQCPKSYYVKALLMIHLKTHRKEYDFICEVCGKAFVLQSNLREHMKKHTGAKVTCNICNLKLRKSSLSRHLRLVHVAYEGTIETTFRAKCHHYKSLLRPPKSHNYKNKRAKNRKYNCKVCKISFEKYKSIVEHNKEFHSDVPNWPCKLCFTKFRHKLDLKRHYRKKHNMHVLQVFKLVEQNEDLNEVLAIKTEQVDELSEHFGYIKCEPHNETKSNYDMTILKSDLDLSETEICFEEEKIHCPSIQDEIMDAADNIEIQDIKIDMSEFFTDL